MTPEASPSWEEIYEFFKTRPLMGTWPPAELEKLARAIEVMRVPARTPVFEARDQADDAWIIYAGQVRQSVASSQGDEWWHRTLLQGDFFTQQALFRGASYASAATAERDSVLLHISAATLSELLVKHPNLWSIFYTNTAARLQAIPLLRSLDDIQIERLSVAATEHTLEAGDVICAADQAEGFLYIIDWGQVRITEQMQTELSGGGRLIVTDATPEVVQGQGFAELPHLLTAGNYFVGGRVSIPHQASVSAVAATRVSLISLAGTYLEQLEQRFSDVHYMLRHRLAIAARLEQALKNEPLFADLSAEHWAALETIASWEHVPSNLDVTRQGQIGSKLYVLAAGAALVRATDDSGRERPRHYSRVGVKDYYGVNALLHGDRHDATVRSMVDKDPSGEALDGTDWLTLQHDDVLYLLESNSELWQHTRLWQEIREKPKIAKQYTWQEDDEEIVLFKRRHVLWLILRLLVVFGGVYLSYAAIVLLDSVMGRVEMTPASYALVAVLLLGLPLTWFVVDYLNDYYIISNKRVMRQARVLLVYENRQTAPLERIQDVTSRASIFGKIFNYADLDISTAGMGVISFDNVPNPTEVETTIRRLQGAAKAGEAAEERENLRNKILAKLKMRLIPSIPDRVLPEGMTAPQPVSRWRHAWDRATTPWRRFRRWLRSRPEAIYMALIGLLPKDSQERMLAERRQRRRAKPEPAEDDIVYRKHPWFLLKAAAIPLAVIGISVVLVIFTEFSIQSLRQFSQPIAVAYVVFLAICIFWLWFRIENWRNDVYILSKTHISYVYKIPLGLFERRRQAEWDKVQNANYVVPGLWANLINYGTVVVETASVEGRFEFLNIGNPRMVHKEIMMRIGLTRAAQSRRERERQQAALSDTLEIYNELIQDWTIRNQQVGAPPPPGVHAPTNGQHTQ